LPSENNLEGSGNEADRVFLRGPSPVPACFLPFPVENIAELQYDTAFLPLVNRRPLANVLKYFGS